MRGHLTYDVAAMVVHKKAITLAELAFEFPRHTKDQIHRALHNAREKGLVRCVQVGKQHVWGATDVRASDYKPKRGSRVAVTSAFDLGGVEVSRVAGKRYSPLGAWES